MRIKINSLRILLYFWVTKCRRLRHFILVVTIKSKGSLSLTLSRALHKIFKNVCYILIFNYFESSSPNYVKCRAFLLQYCTFQLHFSRAIVHFNLSPNPVETLLLIIRQKCSLEVTPSICNSLCLLKEGCWQAWGGNHFFLNNFDVKRQLCNSRWPSGDNFLHDSLWKHQSDLIYFL